MKYKIGDKVKYDSGDWVFFGTVTAIIENSICPSYRVNVERMEKSNCKLSITQFEFELESDKEVVSETDKFDKDNLKIEYYKKQYATQGSKKIKPEPVLLPTPETEPEQDQAVQLILLQEETKSPSTPKIRDSWERHFAAYLRGEKTNLVSTWAYQNRKQYQRGTLQKEKIDRLTAINFSFDAMRNKKSPKATETKSAEKKVSEKKASEKKAKEPSSIWEKQYRQWKNGDRRDSLQRWRRGNVKRFTDGKLSEDKIQKLREVGILK